MGKKPKTNDPDESSIKADIEGNSFELKEKSSLFNQYSATQREINHTFIMVQQFVTMTIAGQNHSLKLFQKSAKEQNRTIFRLACL
jgi:hypothetical protein